MRFSSWRGKWILYPIWLLMEIFLLLLILNVFLLISFSRLYFYLYLVVYVLSMTISHLYFLNILFQITKNTTKNLSGDQYHSLFDNYVVFLPMLLNVFFPPPYSSPSYSCFHCTWDFLSVLFNVWSSFLVTCLGNHVFFVGVMTMVHLVYVCYSYQGSVKP